MNRIEIVPFRPEYLPRIIEITLEGFQGVSVDFLVEEQFGEVDPGWQERKATDVRQAAQREPEGIFVAVTAAGEGGSSADSEEVVGYVTVLCSPEKSLGRIADLAVDKRYRRRGLGGALIEKALDYMRMRGLRLAKIETLTTNSAGQVAYPKLGFVEVARQIHYVMPLKGSSDA